MLCSQNDGENISLVAYLKTALNFSSPKQLDFLLKTF